MVSISKIETPFGLWRIEGSDLGITGIFPTNSDIFGPENAITKQASQELIEYFVHIRTEFSTPLDLHGTEFQKSVWAALRQIPFGETRSYSQVACAMGRPDAVRAVAQAIGRNPCLVFIPCHRVLGKDGSLTGFSAGLDIKKALLNLEEISWKP